MTDRGNVITLTPKNRKKPTPRGGGSLADTLDQATDWINKYSVHLTEHEARVMALWAAHTWVSEAFYVTPRIIFSSATPQSGKTRQLELLENITCSPERTENDTPAVLFRSIEKGHEAGHPPTILFDETDAMFNGSGDGKQEELRGIANSGYKKGGRVRRCVGPDNELKVFHTFAPVAFAGIAGNMPDTITTRAVTVEMRKRKPGEAIEPYYIARAAEESAPIRQWFAQWADTPGLVESLEFKHPSLPPGVEDRPAEVWTALMVIAELAGEHWPGWASEACEYFVRRPSMEDRPKNVRLLDDIRTVMRDTTAIRSSDLCSELRSLEDAEWSQMGDAGIRPHDLSRMLRPFGVAPAKVFQNGRTFRGYTINPTEQDGRAQVGLQDAWDRHLSPALPAEEGNIRNKRNGAGQAATTPGHTATQVEGRGGINVPALSKKGNAETAGETGHIPDIPDIPVLADQDSSSGEVPAVPGSQRNGTRAQLAAKRASLLMSDGTPVSDEAANNLTVCRQAMTVGDAVSVSTLCETTGMDNSLALIALLDLVSLGEATKIGPLFKRVK